MTDNTEEVTLSFHRQPNNVELVKKHARHIYDFQQLCLKTGENSAYKDEVDWDEMHYESLGLGFLLGRDVPLAEAVELAVVGNIEPVYPKAS